MAPYTHDEPTPLTYRLGTDFQDLEQHVKAMRTNAPTRCRLLTHALHPQAGDGHPEPGAAPGGHARHLPAQHGEAGVQLPRAQGALATGVFLNWVS